ncbi:MAG: hypothetical protein ACJAQ3_003198 [Planctomycetota bacterium]|jgi:hypothetical protein
MTNPDIDFVTWLGEALSAWSEGGPGAAELVLMRHPAATTPRLAKSKMLNGARLTERCESDFGFPAGGESPHSDLTDQAKDDAIERLQLQGGSRCCYCGRRLVSRLVHALIATQFEDTGLWPTGWPWRASHPALWYVWPALEHVWPKKRDGHWRDERNLAIACWACNETKSNFFIEEIRAAGFDWPSPLVRHDNAFDGFGGLALEIWKRDDLEARDLGMEKGGLPWPSRATTNRWVRSAERTYPRADES